MILGRYKMLIFCQYYIRQIRELYQAEKDGKIPSIKSALLIRPCSVFRCLRFWGIQISDPYSTWVFTFMFGIFHHGIAFHQVMDRSSRQLLFQWVPVQTCLNQQKQNWSLLVTWQKLCMLTLVGFRYALAQQGLI